MTAMLKQGTDCTSTDGLVALIFQCGPRYEPLGEAPFRSRGHSNLRHKGLVGLAHRRSDLLTASSDSRLAEETNYLQFGFGNYAATVVAMEATTTTPGFTLTCRASKGLPLVITAHRMRAFLLASATAAFCQPDFSRSLNTH